MREIAGLVLAAVFGLVFGLGLVVSQMTDPARIIAFLDVLGDWNPSLLFVMVSAVITAAPAFWLARHSHTHHALLGDDFQLPPNRTKIDSPLIVGAAMFGVGWGLAGLCPGPALALLGTIDIGALLFVPAMIVGAMTTRFVRARNAAKANV